MWSISAILLALVGAGLATGGQLWGLFLLILAGLCGAKAESNIRDQEIALALALLSVMLLVCMAAGIAAWNWVKVFWMA